MNDLRTAAQQALEALENCTSEHGHRCNRCDSEVDEGGRVVTALRAALAQAEQEPVAWGLRNDEGEIFDCIPPVPHSELSEYDVPLYTTPPCREWQGLTDTDIARVFRAVYGGTRFGPSEKEFAIAIEAKLKEKNDG